MGYYEQLIGAYRERGILVDSGLLLLLFVGLCDRGRIQTFKRTKMFTESDFDLLQGIVRQFDMLVTTPNILTEVSNLLGQLSDNLHARYYANFARSLQERVDEYYIPSRQLALLEHFPRLGLTDTGIIEQARNGHLVLTVDLPLYNHLCELGVHAINFNYVRASNLLR
jgi:hypothetical protein